VYAGPRIAGKPNENDGERTRLACCG
jgi:hypothetical protein